MRAHLVSAAAAAGGLITRTAATQIVPVHVVDKALRSGAIVRVFAHVYALPELCADPWVRRRAALLSVAGSALSHTDALALWRALPPGANMPAVHLTVADDGRQRGRQPGLVVHRRAGFRRTDCLELGNSGVVSVGLPDALVDCWPLLPSDQGRAAVIVAVRDGRVAGARIAERLQHRPRTRGAGQLRGLLRLLDSGCQSELEIWGVHNVFDHPSLPPSRPQHRVQLGGDVVFLDRAYVDELVDVELDGAAYHFLPAQRERDMRRDELLTALGWVVVRLSWRRMRADPAGVRQALRELLATRRSQLQRTSVT